MASYLISDAPYAPWLSEVLATLEEHKIDRITVAAPLADGEVFTGRGADGDIIVSSAKAYINALNRLISHKQEKAQ